jgi:benzil reductase ((S)-benzoin forming)
MKHYIFLTGSSKGLGKSLKHLLLERPDTFLCGISRSPEDSHQNQERYRHYSVDLAQFSSTERVLPFFFGQVEKPASLTLINNAAILGKILHVGEGSSRDFARVMAVNAIAVMQLTNFFLEKYKDENCPKTIINLSSGAAKRPVDGWAAYCASKAALEMFSQVVQAEQDLKKTGVRVISFSPGVMDTPMQAEIRRADKAHFSQLERFQNLHAQQELPNPDEVAQKIISLFLPQTV